LLTDAAGPERDALALALSDAIGGPRAAKLLKAKYTTASFALAAKQAAATLHIYENASDTLALLKEQYDIAVVTSLPGWMAAPMLSVVGLGDQFRFVQTAAWRVPAKPNPASLNLALSAIGTPARHSVYIGDSQTDADAASRAGSAFIGAGWGYGRLLGADVATNWAQVRSAI
jgi:phosphoglycolate phosphatase-like HAD superfamily hydrolase